MKGRWLFSTVFVVFIILGICSTSLHARETLRERIKGKIAQRWSEQKAPTGAAVDSAGKTEKQSGYSVGYIVKSINVIDVDGNNAKVDIAIWYPTDVSPQQFFYNYGNHAVGTRVALGGKAAEGPFPLIVYSHGASGSGLSSAFITEELARQGFIVAAPDYPDQYYQCRIRGDVPFQKKRPALILKWLADIRENQLNKKAKIYRKILSYRPIELRSVIDFMLTENKNPQSPLCNMISNGPIGFMGHSFGAWTSILVSGADPEFRDNRVGAAVILSSPVNEYVYTVTSKNELANVSIPILFMYGEKEKEKGRQSDYQYLYLPANPPKYLFEIPDADHFSFSGGVKKEYDTIDGYKQDVIRKPIIEMTGQFFKAYLRRDEESLAQLQKSRYDAVKDK